MEPCRPGWAEVVPVTPPWRKSTAATATTAAQIRSLAAFAVSRLVEQDSEKKKNPHMFRSARTFFFFNFGPSRPGGSRRGSRPLPVVDQNKDHPSLAAAHLGFCFFPHHKLYFMTRPCLSCLLCTNRVMRSTNLSKCPCPVFIFKALIQKSPPGDRDHLV